MNDIELKAADDKFLKNVKIILELPDDFQYDAPVIGQIIKPTNNQLIKLVNVCITNKIARDKHNADNPTPKNIKWCISELIIFFGIDLIKTDISQYHNFMVRSLFA